MNGLGEMVPCESPKYKIMELDVALPDIRAKLSATLNKDKLLYPDQHLSYPELSALGVVITLATLPVTLIIRRLLEKYGPSED